MALACPVAPRGQGRGEALRRHMARANGARAAREVAPPSEACVVHTMLRARRRAIPAGTAKADHRRDRARCQASRAGTVADALPPLGPRSRRQPEERRGEAVGNAHRACRPEDAALTRAVVGGWLAVGGEESCLGLLLRFRAD